MSRNGFYNEENLGIINQEFLKSVKSEVSKKKLKYVVLEGWFNSSGRMVLQDILNEMHKSGYEFVQFVTLDRNVYGEMMFKKVE